jgi:hypothetical protein
MTGGFCMHIHSYQIHNVLNVYRKQLSKGTARNFSRTSAKNQPDRDKVNISIGQQRQSIFDKISSEIVERITRFGPDTALGAVLADQMDQTSGAEAHKTADLKTDEASQNDSAFTYTLIDKHNRKITQSLPIRQFSFPTADMESMSATQKDNDTNSDLE